MCRLVTLVMCAPWAIAALAQPRQSPPFALFTQFGLTPPQIAAIDQGRPVAKVLPWGGPSEVFVFGAVRVNGAPEAYLKAARDVRRLAGTPGYLGVGELSATATVADLSGLTLDADDVKALKSCREADCEFQLPTATIRELQTTVDWSRPDAAVQVNALARERVLGLIREYQRGGNSALGIYRDKEHPARVAEQFETMVGRATTVPDVLPELRRYLLQYPSADLPGADHFFYWEKVAFGMKPTIRVNHGIVFHTRADNRNVSVVAIKQLYASHYFHTALDVSACVDDSAASRTSSFYLVTLKSSEQDGLTGFKGTVLRKIVIDKTRSSLETALASVKRTVEQAAPVPAH
jgi:hypothetical protein